MSEKTRLESQEKKVIDFLQLHYEPLDEMYSYVIFGCTNNVYYNQDYVKNRNGIKNFQYVKTTDINLENKSIQNIIKSLNKKQDYYITQNGFTTPMHRDSSHVFTYHNIVIDIDCHNKRMTDAEMQHTIDAYRFFLGDLFWEFDFPTPNTIVNTGRGLQLWWAINPISYKLKYIYDGVRKSLIKQIDAYMNGIETLTSMKIDKAASHNYAGYFRMPGSYNSKTGSFSTFELMHSERLEIMERYFNENPPPKKRQVKQRQIANQTKNGLRQEKSSLSRRNNLIKNRETMLYNLLELRRYENEEGYRDLMLLILYNAYLSTGKSKSEGLEAVENLNVNFVTPLTAKEIKSYMSTSTKKKYKFSNKKIIDLLNLTTYEQEYLKFYENNKEYVDYDQKREEKKKRNELILKLAKNGYSQQKIAEETNCSQATVSRVLLNSKKIVFPDNTKTKKIS